MQFTKEELKEIEKVFDCLAGESTNKLIRLITAIDSANGNEEIKKKFFKEFAITFDAYRTISAKAELMQKENEVKP
jgi:hypothetical protein